MKRTIFIVTAILAAGLIQAAQINWGTDTTYTVNDTGNNPLTTGQGYLVYLGSGNNGTVTTDGSGNWIFGNGAQVVAGTGNPLGFDLGGNGQTLTQNLAFSWPSAYANGSQFRLIFTDTDSAGALILPNAGNYYISGTYTLSVADDSGQNNYFLSSNVQANNSVVNPVPEPCTMALAFVGAGAMALRRRFAKKA